MSAYSSVYKIKVNGENLYIAAGATEKDGMTYINTTPCLNNAHTFYHMSSVIAKIESCKQCVNIYQCIVCDENGKEIDGKVWEI